MIYLDLDGPILDVSERCFRVHLDSIGEASAASSADKNAFWMLKRNRVGIAELIARTAPSVDEQTYLQRWLERIEEPQYLKYDRLVPGAVPVLHALREHYPLFLVTLRRDRATLEWELEAKGLRALFHDVLSGFADTIPPWQVKKQLILRRPPAATPRSLIVGDTEADILAGKALGLMTVATTNGIRTRELLEALRPDFIIQDLTSLPTLLTGSRIDDQHRNGSEGLGRVRG